MYNALLPKEGLQFSPASGYSRSLPRPHNSIRSDVTSLTGTVGASGRGHRHRGPRTRSRSPGRPQLALVICPDFLVEFPEGMREYSAPSSPVSSARAVSPQNGGGSKFFYPPSPWPVPHSLARTRGELGLRDTNSLPCSPVLNRPVNAVARDVSLPGSPGSPGLARCSLPRIQVQDYERIVATASEVSLTFIHSLALYIHT